MSKAFCFWSIMNVDIKFTDEQLIQTIYKAAQEYENLVGKGFLFIAKPKKGPYYWFECKFEAKNFPHLLGIKHRMQQNSIKSVASIIMETVKELR